MTFPYLLADIGATNARFALLQNDEITRIKTMMVADYERMEDAIAVYLKEIPDSEWTSAR